MAVLVIILFVPLVFCVIAVLVGGKKSGFIIFGLLAVFIIYAEIERRSIPGRIVRWFAGTGTAYQEAEDEAEDLRGSPFYSELQNWSADTMKRFQAGQLTINTNIDPYFGNFYPDSSSIRLSSNEKPEFINQRWGETNMMGEESPQIYILNSTKGQPEAVAIAWYSHCLLFGNSNYNSPFEPRFWRKVTPGVYEVVFEK